jgi:hypothetical protein
MKFIIEITTLLLSHRVGWQINSLGSKTAYAHLTSKVRYTCTTSIAAFL